MIYDTSYSDKETTKKIDEAVGKAFSFKERWKMGGIGSPRMTIGDISKEYKKYLNADHYISNANIQLRPKGILIHFRHKLQAYTWVMPFSSLEIIWDEYLTLKSEGKHITFKEGINRKFIHRLEKCQVAFNSV